MLGIKTDLLKQIADSLASHGIASFRFDKRAIRHYQNFWPKSTSELNEFFGWDKFVSDAHAAFLVLKAQPEVDPAHVGLLGHSEGSLISLQLGADTAGEPDQPAAMILIGCTGRPMGPVLHDQIQYRLKLSGASADLTKTYLDYLDAACTALADEKPLPPDTPQGLKTLFNPAVLNIVGAYCRMQPVDLAKRYRRDVLVVNGDKDTQVSAIKDTPKLVTAFRMRRTGTVEAMIVIDASHCLKSTSKGDLDQFEGPVVDGVLDRIAKFANAHL
jgi:pimeloyl-ACP methyl ester carboxylesterase